MIDIIAEIGSNHNGCLDTAKTLIKASAQAGATIAKFQSFIVDDMIPKSSPNYERMKQLEIPKDWYPQLFDCCKEHNITFLSTATSETSLAWMQELDVPMYKVASGNVTHRPIIDKLIEINKPLILSLGFLQRDEIIELENYFKAKNFSKYSFMHCVAKYPTDICDVHLKNISTLKEMCSCEIGFSDHTLSLLTPAIAVSLGATIIEKHITLDHTGIGLDHDVAITPAEFKVMVQNIKDTSAMLTEEFKIDEKLIYKARRSLHFNKALKAGSIIKDEDIKITRPENGLLPLDLPLVIGKTLLVDVEDETPLKMELLQ